MAKKKNGKSTKEKMATEERELQVKLTRDELEKRGLELAEAEQSQAFIKAEKKDANATYNRELKTVHEKITRLAETVKTKREMRPVECQWAKNFETKQMELTRLDTDQIVEKRPMTDREKQKGMEFEVEGKNGQMEAGIDTPF